MTRVLNRGLLLFLGGNVDKRILIGVGVAVAAGALWVGYTLLNPVITLKKCNKVTTEMKRDDVVKLMGMQGEKRATTFYTRCDS
jgi:drug/metabolite transporter (DMT)-like permease